MLNATTFASSVPRVPFANNVLLKDSRPRRFVYGYVCANKSEQLTFTDKQAQDERLVV